jgi:DMSO/TMAO reductase YedYZ molybdopterin-dependent catalytic subunit
MEAVPRVVEQDMWSLDENSFLLTWPLGEKRLTVDELKTNYPVNTVRAELNKTTGTKIDVEGEGVYLTDILAKEGIDLSVYPGVGISGRDGYYTMIDKDKLNGDILLAYKVDGKDLKSDERPVRLILPDEMGPYWVKMISRIELYYEIAEKDIDTLYMFEPLVRDLEPYYYEYFGSKDKAYEVVRILD